MKIVRNTTPTMTLEEFGTRHTLTLVLNERPQRLASVGRFYVNFDLCELREGVALVGVHGNGDTEADAIADYIRQLPAGELLVHRRQESCRVDIVIPHFTEGVSDATGK